MRIMSASVMLPNTPHTRTRSAGTAPAYDAVAPASAHSTSMPAGRVRPGRRRQLRVELDEPAATSPRRGWSSSTPRRSRPSPAHMLTTRIGPGGAASSASADALLHDREPARERAVGRSYAVCHSCQSCASCHRTESSHDLPRRSVGNRVARQGIDQGHPRPSRARARRVLGAQRRQGRPRRRRDLRHRPDRREGDEQPRRDLRARRRCGRLLAGDGEHPRRDPAARVGQERRDARGLDLSGRHAGCRRGPGRVPRGQGRRCTAPASIPAASPNASR